jgi:hypothetical protein
VRRVARIHFKPQALDMALDSPDAEVDFSAGLPCRVALRDQLEYFGFRRGKLISRRKWQRPRLLLVRRQLLPLFDRRRQSFDEPARSPLSVKATTRRGANGINAADAFP